MQLLEGGRLQIDPVRYIRRSEVRALLDCEAKWDFRYGDRLAGSSIVPIEPIELLRAGTGWDTIVKGYNRGENVGALLRDSSVYMGEDGRIPKLAMRYATSRSPMGTVEIMPIVVQVQEGVSLAIEPDDLLYIDDEPWFVEYKLRQSLTSIEYLYRDMQGMLYVWAARLSGFPVRGIIFDETLNEYPSEMRYKKNGEPSKVQSCSPAEYAKGCLLSGVDPDIEVLNKLESRATHQRVPIEHFKHDLEGLPDLIASAHSHIRALEKGIIYPKRTRNPMICRHCEFNRVCEHPDPDLVDFTFTRRPAKRDRNDGYAH